MTTPTRDTRLAYSTEHHTTTDLSCAAFLMARGHPLLRTERQPNGRCVFTFPAEARDDAHTFYAGAQVPARGFANALRDLKALTREV
jgi:uncharacterized protein DUF5659